jgi:hypothetical protein
VVAVFSSILILKRLFRRKQPIDSYCTATDEVASMKIVTARNRFKKQMILVCVLICTFFAWLAWRFAAAHGQQQIVAEVLQLGGSISYDFEPNPGAFQAKLPPPEPAWIVKLLGVDFLHNVIQVDFYPGQPDEVRPSPHRANSHGACWNFVASSMTKMSKPCRIEELESVWLGSQGITDASVETTEAFSLKIIGILARSLPMESVGFQNCFPTHHSVVSGQRMGRSWPIK